MTANPIAKNAKLIRTFVAYTAAGDWYVLKLWADETERIFTTDFREVFRIGQGHYRVDDDLLWSDDPNAP